MATGFASALSEGQPAQLDLGEEAVPCLVVGFTGADVVLAPDAPSSARGALVRADRLSADRGRRHACRRSRPQVRRGRQPTASSSRRCSTPSASASAATSPARRSSCPRTCARLGDAGRAEDHLHARHQRRRPARRAPVLLPRGRRARGRDRARAGQPRDPAHGRDRARDRRRRLAQLHRDRGRGPAPPGPADVRVPPPPRRAVAHLTGAQYDPPSFPTGRRRMAGSRPGLGDRERAQKSAEVEPRLLLVHFLRDTLGLTGTHVGCDTSNCGACTVHLDGEAVKRCTVLAVQADGAEVTTIEGMGQRGRRCTRCRRRSGSTTACSAATARPGMIMAARRPARNATRTRPRRRSARRSRATSAAAPATTTSSRPCWPRRGRGARMTAHRASRPAGKWVGQALQRKEDPRLITGRAPLRRRHRSSRACCTRRSCARPRRTRRSSRSTRRRARGCPASTAVFTGEDLDLEPRRCRWPGCRRASRSTTRRALAARQGRGQATSASRSRVVIGDDKYAVVDAAEQVLVEYDPLPVVVDPEKALEDGAPLVHEDLGTNKVPRVVARRRRHRGRLRGGRRRGRAARSSTTAPRARRSSRAAWSPTTAPAR